MKNATAKKPKTCVHSTQLRTIRIPVSSLQVGMYISDIDRPWVETPFLLQGFHVKDLAEVDKVQLYCEYVYIEESYSPKAKFKSNHRMQMVTSRVVNGPRKASSNDSSREDSKSAGPSFTTRFLLFSLLLAGPVQASAFVF
jgi:hypothetical protein